MASRVFSGKRFTYVHMIQACNLCLTSMYWYRMMAHPMVAHFWFQHGSCAAEDVDQAVALCCRVAAVAKWSPAKVAGLIQHPKKKEVIEAPAHGSPLLSTYQETSAS